MNDIENNLTQTSTDLLEQPDSELTTNSDELLLAAQLELYEDNDV